MKQKFILKPEVRLTDLYYMQTTLLLMISFTVNYCNQNELPCVWTSFIRSPQENKRVKAKSITHVEGRAADLSLHGWSDQDIKNYEIAINNEFENIGAYTYGLDGLLTSTPIVIHNSHDNEGNPIGIDHAHLQVRPL